MDKFVLHPLLESFLREDLSFGDITSESTIPADQIGQAQLVAKEAFVVAGIEHIAPEVFRLCSNQIQIGQLTRDGQKVSEGSILLELKGPVQALLKGERVALNIAQRLSGIATLTAAYVAKTALLPVRILDTRKTTPGLRMLEKYAVRVGGGHNHRFSLSDGILIKDNHIAASGSISKAVKKVRNTAPHTLKIEVEASTLDEVEACLSCGVDAILLDNMDAATIKRAVKMVQGQALLEASGGINLENVREIAETGVNFISVGALTHSAKACDISMRVAPIAPAASSSETA